MLCVVCTKTITDDTDHPVWLTVVDETGKEQDLPAHYGCAEKALGQRILVMDGTPT